MSPSNYAALDGYVYCKPHFAQLFKEKGSYSSFNKSIADKKGEVEGEVEPSSTGEDIAPLEVPASDDAEPSEEPKADD